VGDARDAETLIKDHGDSTSALATSARASQIVAMTTSRRDFLASTAAACLGGRHLTDFRPGTRTGDTYELVLRGGTVFDGLGADGQEMDVAISGGRIAEMGLRIQEQGREEVDVRGMAVAPGFIDIHSHGEGTLVQDPRAESVIRQGITTIAVGADGSSRATGSPNDSFASLFAWIDATRGAPAVIVRRLRPSCAPWLRWWRLRCGMVRAARHPGLSTRPALLHRRRS
jgi:hypothetical protein